MKKVRFGRICVVSGVMLLMTALGGTAGATELKPWRHGIIKAKSDAGILMMVNQGFAKKRGLELKILQFKNAVIEMQALLAGELDSFEGDPSGAIVAAARGAEVKIIGCHWPGLPHGIFVRKDINSVKELAGKTIAISAPGGLPDVLARAMLEKEGISPSQVKFANLGGSNDRFKALAAHVADAAVLSDEYVPIAAKQGAKLLLAGSKILPDYMRLCIMSSPKVLSTKHDEAVRFLAAEMTALRYALSHRDETLKLTSEASGEKPGDPRPAYVFDQAANKHVVDPTMAIPLNKLGFMQNLLITTRRIQKPMDLTKLVDDSIRAQAFKLVGK